MYRDGTLHRKQRRTPDQPGDLLGGRVQGAMTRVENVNLRVRHVAANERSYLPRITGALGCFSRIHAAAWDRR